jgi:hypothetical protein
MQMPSFAQAGAAQMNPNMLHVSQPENRTWEAAQMEQNTANANRSGMAGLLGSIGNAVGNSWGGGSGGGYDPWSGSGSGGNAGVQYPSSADPWSGYSGYSTGIWA